MGEVPVLHFITVWVCLKVETMLLSPNIFVWMEQPQTEVLSLLSLCC